MSNDNDKQFEAWLRANLSQLREGSCPSVDKLAQFAQGKAPELEAHVAGCGYCDLAVERIRGFERALRHEKFQRLTWLLPIGAVLLLAYPAYLGLKPHPPVLVREMVLGGAQQPVLESAQVIQLDATRSAKPSAPGVVGATGVVALEFFVPIQEGHHYTASITGAATMSISEISSYDRKGNFSLIVERSRLPRGSYKLTVTDKVSPATAWVFPFEL